jgi:carboxyl-terminal processing protease
MFIVLVLTAGAAFWAGVWFSNATDSPHNDDDFQVFWQSWDILEREFYRDLPADTDLVYGATRGLLAVANDPYTFFQPPGAAELDRQRTAGEFGGIGAYVSQNQAGQLVIASPFAGLPADEAGLLPNDVILAVDGVSIKGLALDEAVGLLRGDIGTKVALTIYRALDDSQFAVEITRARVDLPTIQSAMRGDVGYVRLFSFNERATSSLESEIADLQAQGAQALILDLRGNPGGLLDQAVAVSDLFLGEGVVVTQRDRRGKTIEYRSDDGDPAETIPLVVLLDGGSASASEVVAGALKDRGRATLIGETSFGKGSVQHVYNLPDESQVRVTVAAWFTPKETPIDGQGLEPDIPVVAPDNLTPDEDPFVDAALAYFEKEK